MKSNDNNAGFQSKTHKKQYTKPTLQVIELRPEERLAGSKIKINCAACQGANACTPAGNHGEGV